MKARKPAKAPQASTLAAALRAAKEAALSHSNPPLALAILEVEDDAARVRSEPSKPVCRYHLALAAVAAGMALAAQITTCLSFAEDGDDEDEWPVTHGLSEARALAAALVALADGVETELAATSPGVAS